MFEKEFFHFNFPQEFTQWHISALEALVIVIAAKQWGKAWKGKIILVRCDNEAVVHLLNTGKSKCPLLLRCAREIAFMSAVGGFYIWSLHIQGLENRRSDFLSRWSLGPQFQEKFWEEVKGEEVQEVIITPDKFQFTANW